MQDYRKWFTTPMHHKGAADLIAHAHSAGPRVLGLVGDGSLGALVDGSDVSVTWCCPCKTVDLSGRLWTLLTHMENPKSRIHQIHRPMRPTTHRPPGPKP